MENSETDNYEDYLEGLQQEIVEDRIFLRSLTHDTNRGRANLNFAIRDHYEENGINAEPSHWEAGQRAQLRVYEIGVRYQTRKIARLEARLAQLTRDYYNRN